MLMNGHIKSVYASGSIGIECGSLYIKMEALSKNFIFSACA